MILEQAGDYRFTNVVIQELENVSGGQVNIITDRDVPTVTDTGPGSITDVSAEAIITVPNGAEFNILAVRADNGQEFEFAEGVTSFVVTTPLNVAVSYAIWVEGFDTFVGGFVPSQVSSLEAPVFQANDNIDLSIDTSVFLDDIDITLAPNDYSIVLNAPVTMNIEQMKAVIHRVMGREVSLRASVAAGPGNPALTINPVSITINLPIVFLRRGSGLTLDERVEFTGFIDQAPAQLINPAYQVNPSNADGIFVLIPAIQAALDPTQLAIAVWDEVRAIQTLDHSRAANLQTQAVAGP